MLGAGYLADMSRLDVYVLVAMAHLDYANDKPFNFQMVFEEYARFAASEIAPLQMFPKPVALKVCAGPRTKAGRPCDPVLTCRLRCCGVCVLSNGC